MLMTVDRVQYYFSEASIVAVSDHDPSTGKAVTCVYGLSESGYLAIQDPAPQFVSGLGANFGKLAAANGGSYWIATALATSVCAPVAPGAPPGATSVVFAGSVNFFVQESLSQAAAILKLS
jgi:hypothetical protein